MNNLPNESESLLDILDLMDELANQEISQNDDICELL